VGGKLITLLRGAGGVHWERNVLDVKYIEMFRPFLDLLGALLPTVSEGVLEGVAGVAAI
jgi:hypothetical protein